MESSFMDFLLPSAFAQSALYYMPQYGRFVCNEHYHISREFVDLFLLIYVCEGAMEVETRGKIRQVSQGEIALVDCRYPHRYRALGHTDFLWFHFRGSGSAEYAELLLGRSGCVFAGEHIPKLRRQFDSILSCAQQHVPNEHMISMNIHIILTHLASPSPEHAMINTLLHPALEHIHNHFSEPIVLKPLASLCNMSTSHFIRCFKKHIDCTPHQYILSYRLRQAKQILSTTTMPIELVAEKCGFNSASHFARAFRKSIGIRPTEFRHSYPF